MFPHERSLVDKMKNRPFALLGVNTDANVADVKQKNTAENISWRSWFDGKSNVICGKYKVQGFPTLYLLDSKGVIKKKWLGGPNADELDGLIEELVKDAEKGAPKASASNDSKPSDDKPAASALADSKIGLAIGDRAPEILGKDLDGDSFKLSDYRGKVVLLDFWGHW
jgi:peroxiredoxin